MNFKFELIYLAALVRLNIFKLFVQWLLVGSYNILLWKCIIFNRLYIINPSVPWYGANMLSEAAGRDWVSTSLKYSSLWNPRSRRPRWGWNTWCSKLDGGLWLWLSISINKPIYQCICLHKIFCIDPMSS